MVRFKMIGYDLNSQTNDRGLTIAPTQFRTWVVNDTPDFTGQFYTGQKSGPLPLADVHAYAIFDDSAVVDFNLPLPENWSSEFSVLPATIYDSQLAIIDGYAYLFGGVNSNVIWQASLNSPTVWYDTGARLPTPLAGSSFAIINETIYLFGGQTDASLTSGTPTVFSAPLSNPLQWTNDGYVLPFPLSHSQLLINETDGYIYLFGGYQVNYASAPILKAPISNPLAWTVDGYLPNALYGSHLAINDGYAYLLGGLLDPQTPTAAIIGAPFTNLSNWTVDGYLPYPSFYGQFCTVGAQGYLFTQAAVTNGETNTLILQCQLDKFTSSWIDTGQVIPGTISQSQLAIIYDRVWLFGGNANTIIFACNSLIKWPLTFTGLYGQLAYTYGQITRTQYQAAESDPFSLIDVIGFPYWKTDYGA